MTLPVSDRRLVAEPLMLREDVAIFGPDHPLAGRRRVRFETLLAHPLVLLDRGSRTRSWIDACLAATGAGSPRIAMELASIEVVKRLVALGFGASVVPRIAVEEELAAGTLCAARLPGGGDRARRLGVVYPRNGALSRAAAAFVELARELL